MKTYYLFRIASALAKVVPIRVGYWLCSVVGSLIFYFSPKTREAVLNNLGHVMPDASRHKRRGTARKIVRNVIKNYYDLVRLPYLDKKEVELKVTVRNIELLDAAIKSGRGVIMVGGHIGNFQLAAQVAAARGYAMSIIAEDIEPPALYNYVNKLRSRFGLKMIKLGTAEVRTIYRLLKNGEGLMLAVDRDVSETSIPMPFFDAPVEMPPGPVALALKLNCVLLPANATRLSNNQNVVTVYPPMELEKTGDNTHDIQENMRRVAKFVEDMIREDPSQWVVLQKVWERDYTESEVAALEPDTGTGQPDPAFQIPSTQQEPHTASAKS